MKITGKIKPIYVNENFDHAFRLKVYFKEEGQWFHRSYERTLIGIWQHDVTYQDIPNKALEYLSNKEGLIKMAKDMVLSYYKNKEKDSKYNGKEKQIKELIKELEDNNITFEMEIK